MEEQNQGTKKRIETRRRRTRESFLKGSRGGLLSSSSLDLPHEVERRPSLDPSDLIFRHRVLRRDLDDGPIGLGDPEGDDGREVSTNERGDTNGLDLVAGVNLGIVGLVGKPKREDALLFQVGLVNTGEAGRGSSLAGIQEGRWRRQREATYERATMRAPP